MKKICIYILALAFACSCVEYVIPEYDLSLEGMWAPVEEGSCTDRYLEFRMGKCYTYISPKILYVEDGRIWGCHINDFVLMSAEDYYIKDGSLVLDGANVGEVSSVGNDLVKIGNETFQHIYELTSSVNKSRSVVQLSLLHSGDPVHQSGKEDFILNMLCGDVDEFKVVVTPLDAIDKDLFWYSDSPEVVSVTQEGMVIANGNGEAWVNVYCKNNLDVKDSCKVVVTTDLSKEGVANCYIAPRPGRYIFPASRYVDGESQYVDYVSGAKLVWSSFNSTTAPKAGEFIKNVNYSEDDRYISFDLDFGDARGGNAVIAAVDGEGKICWSWHIWAVRGFDPNANAETYLLSGQLSGPVCMDRNLGAISSSPERDNESFGLFYEWGRKDPFPCAAGKTDYSPVATYCPGGWNTVSPSGYAGTVEYAIEHPTTFITGSENRWVNDANLQVSLWNPNKKTEYDPCPAGWMLPAVELWKTPGESMSEMLPALDNANKGVHFNNLVWNSGGWYPAAGYLDSSLDRISDIGTRSWVYSATADGEYGAKTFEYVLSPVATIAYARPIKYNYGCQVRCVLQ